MNLIKNIWYLGFKNGVRYWRIQRFAAKYPEISIRLAEELRKEFANEPAPLKDIIFEFAEMLEAAYHHYINNKRK